jgi:hypothetical protein
MRTAVDLDLADYGLRDRLVPDPDHLASSWQAPEVPDFIHAMERVIEAWLDDGRSDAASTAIAAIEAHVGRNTDALGRSSCRLLRARWLAATGSTADATVAAREALAAARESGAPLWIARAIETLERTGGATDDERSERAAISARLLGQAGTAGLPV